MTIGADIGSRVRSLGSGPAGSNLEDMTRLFLEWFFFFLSFEVIQSEEGKENRNDRLEEEEER